MLIDKGIAAGQVISLKLTSGEELIAKLVEETGNGYKLSKPLVLSMSPQGIGMIPFMFTVNPDKELLIKKESVIALQSTDTQFADQYTQGTTGIALR
jgi:hypothetical protein